MGMHKSMIIDKETDIFLKNRIKSNSKLHHLLNPVELRTERLRQLREDNLTPPKIYNSENLKIKNRFNKDVKLRFYFPNNFNKKTKIINIANIIKVFDKIILVFIRYLFDYGTSPAPW